MHRHARTCAGVRGCTLACVDVHGCVQVCVGVTGVSRFSNNYEFSEYLLETNVFMQWPLIRILFEFLICAMILADKSDKLNNNY